MNYSQLFEAAQGYDEFLERYGTPEQVRRWRDVEAEVALSDSQRALLAGFRREMKVVCLAGVWCGDCAEQCPIFARFAACTPTIRLRFVDRDADPQWKQELSVCGGARVPVVVFLSEDDQPLGRFGDRTLAKYRALAASLAGASCPTGLAIDPNLLAAVTQDWLDEFERNQLILRTSPRLRAKHGD